MFLPGPGPLMVEPQVFPAAAAVVVAASTKRLAIMGVG